MPSIYLTTNLYNKENNILPYLYIGSDQKDNPKYFGSSKKLKEDIKILGKENFKKEIIFYINDIINVELREKEKQILTEMKCAENNIYYNRTNSSHKGYIETEEEKKIRMDKCREGFKKWIKNTPKEERININNNVTNLKKKSWLEWCKEKYTEEEYNIKLINHKKNRTGENNGMSKYTDIQKSKVIELFKLGYKRKNIVSETGVSYGVVKIEIRRYKKENSN